MSGFLVIIMTGLAFLFPVALISSIRSEKFSTTGNYKYLSGFLFSVIIFIIGLFLNTAIT